MSSMDKDIDYFGFLPFPVSISFNGGMIEPHEDFNKNKEWMEKYSNVDGFLYPPIGHRGHVNTRTGKIRKIKNTERPVLLHRAPRSHILRINNSKEQNENRLNLGGFIIQCIGFLYGVRLQFWDGWFEGRIPFKPTTVEKISNKDAEVFLSRAIKVWNNLEVKEQRVLNSLLYLYCKAGAEEWDWERFQLEYIVFDACYRIAAVKDGCKAKSHKSRFNAVISTYGLATNESLISLFIQLRNDLFHEALWGGVQPGTAGGQGSFLASFQFRKFNHRLISAILAGASKYTSSTWWPAGPFGFSV